MVGEDKKKQQREWSAQANMDCSCTGHARVLVGELGDGRNLQILVQEVAEVLSICSAGAARMLRCNAGKRISDAKGALTGRVGEVRKIAWVGGNKNHFLAILRQN